MARDENRQIIILGGFLSFAAVYNGLSQALSEFAGKKVWVVNTRAFDWLPCVSKVGWFLVLNKLDITVRRVFTNPRISKVTLIGHSQGGVLARLYLRPEPFMGKHFNGLEHIDHLITLGSPHLNQGGLQRGGYMSRWIERHVPGSAFSSRVRYTSVAGKFIRGNSMGSRFERFAYGVYKEICAEGEVWGDGMIPVSSALLPGSQQIIIDGVSHYSLLGEPWYGSEEVLPVWWNTED
jgi:pimeloyl-ACP methyl ester carboxylesterase